jgi:hypothetical protein
MDLLQELGKIFFGFVLGFLSHLYWDCRSQKREKERQIEDDIKEDKRSLFEVRKILMEILRAWRSTPPPRPFIQCMDDLSQLSVGIKRKENETIRLDIWKFSGKYRDCRSLASPETREMRKEAEKLKEKIEAMLGMLDHDKISNAQGGEQ